MKYLISLVLGMIAGAVILAAGLYYNPLTTQNKLSPISVTDNDVLQLNYPAVANSELVFTNDGESAIAPHPAKVLQLWEPPIRRTEAFATALTDSRDRVVGIGLKFSSDSESTDILNGKLIVDSVWHVYLPGRGSFFIEQQENYWTFVREVVVPARWNSGDNWRGTWNGNISSGPGALGMAKVVGGSGEFSGLDSGAVESLLAKAYSVDKGPIAMIGAIAVELPRADVDPSPDP